MTHKHKNPQIKVTAVNYHHTSPNTIEINFNPNNPTQETALLTTHITHTPHTPHTIKHNTGLLIEQEYYNLTLTQVTSPNTATYKITKTTPPIPIQQITHNYTNQL